MKPLWICGLLMVTAVTLAVPGVGPAIGQPAGSIASTGERSFAVPQPHVTAHESVQGITPPAVAAGPIFVDVTSGPLGNTGTTTGVAWGDYDNDGDLDLYISNDEYSANRLLRNEGDGTFADATSGSLGDTGNDHGVAWGDYDNDGDLDLYLARAGANILFRNEGNGTFVDATNGPLGDTSTGGGVAWGDYDNDGDLDLYVVNFGQANKLLRNEGNGAFADATSGPLGDTGPGRGVAWGDYDDDGDLDLYLANGGQANRLFRNEGNGSFADVTSGPLGDTGQGTGVAWGDCDNDGDLDLYLANYGTNRLFRNEGDGTFVDATVAPLDNADSDRGVAWGDCDNDGDLDLYIASTATNKLLRNEGGGTFVDATTEPLGDPGTGGTVAWGDYDNDGDIDLYLGKFLSANKLFRNDDPNGNHWLQVNLVGTVSNHSGIGARVTVAAGGVSRIVEVSGGSGYNSQNALTASFGLGTTTVIEALTIRWPSGRVQVVSPPPAVDQRLTVSEPRPFEDSGANLPALSSSTAAWGDCDNDGDLDILMTGKDEEGLGSTNLLISQGGWTFTTAGELFIGVGEGDAAWADYDGDGDLDFAVCGVRRYNPSDFEPEPRTVLYRNAGGGYWSVEIATTFVDVFDGSLAWGDYDNDGDLDLLLTGAVNGLYDLTTRLYRNEGAGSFTDISTTLPTMFLNAAAWGDYDNDGDLDLVMAGYTDFAGATASSAVYRNDGNGVFSDIGAGLPAVRMAAAAWGDYDADGDLDLLLTGYAIGGACASIFRNDGALGFSDIAAGLPGVRSGSAAWGDFDNDGDLDILLSGRPDNQVHVCRNDGGNLFPEIDTELPVIDSGISAWGDGDGDGRLDVLLTGALPSVYFNTAAVFNAPPAAPGGLSSSIHEGGVTLSWSASTDVETPASGLSYNLRVGTTPGGNEIMPAMAEVASGQRRVVELGNVQQSTSWTLSLPPGTYYWSVQAVDGAFAGSPFASEQTLIVPEPSPFVATAGVYSGLYHTGAAWGDFENDGYLDVLVTGDDGASYATRIFHNQSHWMFGPAAELPAGGGFGAAALGDYDGDGDLDFAVCGATQAFDPYEPLPHTNLYRNEDNGDHWTEVASAGLVGVLEGSLAWGDYDNDGDLDLLVTGDMAATGRYELTTRLYRNEGGGAFSEVATGLPAVGRSTIAWGDYDNDGDLDLFLAGSTDVLAGDRISALYRNDGNGAFADVGAGLPGVTLASASWGDCDADGDLDLLLAGTAGSGRICHIYRNDGGTFTDIAAGLPGISSGSTCWGDYDNDGDADILLMGNSPPTGGISRVYRNDGAGGFAEFDLPVVSLGQAFWGDGDNDGDLDALHTANYVLPYSNEGSVPNTPPTTPGGLSSSASGAGVTLSWDPATDAETPVSALSYNLRVGTTPWGTEIMPAMAHVGSGQRRIAQIGNAQQNTSWTLALPPGTYYWSVQAVDGAFAGSPFADEQQVVVTVGVDEELPAELAFALAGANPVRGAARFELALPARARVELSIFDVSGRRVDRLANGELEAGRHLLTWDPKVAYATRSGVFFARLVADGRKFTRRIVVLD